MFDKFAPIIVTVMVALVCGFTIQGKPASLASACVKTTIIEGEKH